jgi:hypothetical protein
MPPISPNWRRGVVALHNSSSLVPARPGAGFSGLQRLSPEFPMVTPEGRQLGRGEIIQGIQASRGRLAASLTIEILDIRTLWQEGDAALLAYIEQQYREGRTTRRRSSALLLRAASAPRGILWRHLQETWESPPANK